MRTNWLQKLSQTGYMDTQLFGEHSSYEKWDDIEKRRDIKRDAAREEAFKKATDNGHNMKGWSNINTTQCKHCGREVSLYNIYSRSNTTIEGRAINQKCDNDIYDTSNDSWEYRMDVRMG